MKRPYYTKDEADQLLDKTIMTTVAWSGVPRGCTGHVVRVDPAGRQRTPDGDFVQVYNVAIQWHLPEDEPTAQTFDVDGEPVLFIRRGGPLIDWFSKDEFEDYLVVIDD